MIRAVRGVPAALAPHERRARPTRRACARAEPAGGCLDDRVHAAGSSGVAGSLLLAVTLAAVISSACGGATTQTAPADAPKTATVPAADASAVQADNPQCKLFTAAEIAKYIGEPVSPGQNAALGTGCQWLAADGTGDVIVAVVPSSYHEPPSAAAGYRALADVGVKGFVAPQLDGWVAGAIIGEDAIRVSAAGATASEATTIALLQDTIKRRAS